MRMYNCGIREALLLFWHGDYHICQVARFLLENSWEVTHYERLKRPYACAQDCGVGLNGRPHGGGCVVVRYVGRR